jgi:DNA-binding Lrp family transcriptional regulator
MTIPETQNPKAKTRSLDDLDRAILNEIQSHFPLESRPYAEVGMRVGASEAEVLDRVRAMTTAGIIRRIGANFTSRKLGYTSTLCAARVEPEALDRFVAAVNRYPGVTHNYLRRHRYNVWFTLIAESEERLQQILKEISQTAEVAEFLSLPAQEVFKIKVDFPL